MAHLRKRKNKKGRVIGYAAEFYDPLRHPARKYVTLRTTDHRLARRKLTEYEQKHSLGIFDPWTDAAPRQGVFVAEAVMAYLNTRGDKRPKTRRADESTLNLFAASLPPGCLMTHIEERHVRAFLDRSKKSREGRQAQAETLSASTRQTYYTRIKAFLEWAIQHGYTRHDPTVKIERPKTFRREKPFFTKKEYGRLLRAIEADVVMKRAGIVDGERKPHMALKDGEIRWLVEVIEVAVATGMRRTELVHMRWSWVNLDKQHVVIRNDGEFIPKGKHERTIPVRGRALEILARRYEERTSESDDYVFKGMQDDDRLDVTYTSKRFKKYVRLAKLSEDYSFHSLRHTYCSWMIQAGVPVTHVQKLAGHASIETTMQYVHLAPETLTAAVERVFAS